MIPRFDMFWIKKATSRGNGRAEGTSPVGGTWESSLNVNKAAGQRRDGEKNLEMCAFISDVGYDWTNIVMCNE